MTQKLPTAGNKMPEVAKELPPMPFEVRRTARVIADVIGETQWASGRNPSVIAASCVFVADLVHAREDRISQMDIDRSGVASSVGIRGQYREIPEVFLEHADDEQRQRLGDNDEEVEYVIKTLDHLRERHEEGYAIDRIDWRPDVGNSV